MVKIKDVLVSWYLPWREYLAEFLGTYVLVFVSLGLVLVNSLYQNLEPFSIALSLGFLYAGLLYVSAHLSGGFLNPVITISLWFVRRLPAEKAFFLLIMQFLAGFAATGTIFYFFGRKSLEFNLGLVAISPEKVQLAIVLEMIFTAVLVFGVFATMVDRNGPVSFGPLVVGLLTVPLTVFAYPVSGAIFNPAKVLAAGLLTKDYFPLIVGLIGPLAASLFAFFYDFIFLSKLKKGDS